MLLASGAEAPRSKLALKLPRDMWLSPPIQDQPRHPPVVGLRSGSRIDRHRTRTRPDPHLLSPFGHNLLARKNGGKPLVVLF
jgi:hypothetical protein